MEKIKVYRKCGKKYDYYYKFFCKECNKDRGYLPNKNAPELCKSCAGKISHSNMSDDTRDKMSKSKKGITTWNKGLTLSDEYKNKISKSKMGNIPYNKGIEMPLEQKIKLSCTNRSINIEDFKDFSTPINRKERNQFSDSGLREQCFLNADYTCDITKEKGVELNAHHLESWHSNEELRYDINNLVCISKEMHDEFHKIYGRKNNTKEQYEEFKSSKLF